MYDPTLGRWLTEDPTGFDAGDANLYRYVRNGPTNGVDPSGLSDDDPNDGLIGHEPYPGNNPRPPDDDGPGDICGNAPPAGDALPKPPAAPMGPFGITVTVGYVFSIHYGSGFFMVSIEGTIGISEDGAGGMVSGSGGAVSGLGLSAGVGPYGQITDAVKPQQLAGDSTVGGVSVGPISLGYVHGNDYDGISGGYADLPVGASAGAGGNSGVHTTKPVLSGWWTWAEIDDGLTVNPAPSGPLTPPQGDWPHWNK